MIPVYFVVFEGVLLLDLTGIAEPLRLANDWADQEGRPRPFELVFVGPEDGARCSLGLRLQDLAPLPERLPPGSWLIVPGASESRESYAGEAARRLVAWLARVGDGAAWRMTVCSGALLAGRAGWLDGRICTTHHDLIERLRQATPAARVLDNRIYVVDHGVATSAGITAGIDLALWAIGEVLGPRGALAVAREMVVFARRAGADPQLALARPPQPPASGGAPGAGRAGRGAGRRLVAAADGGARPRRRAAPGAPLRRTCRHQSAALPAAAAPGARRAAAGRRRPLGRGGGRRGRLRLGAPPAPGLAPRKERQPTPEPRVKTSGADP